VEVNRVLVLGYGISKASLAGAMLDSASKASVFETENRKKLKVKSRKEAAILRNMHNKK